jgi:hypothetical protein
MARLKRIKEELEYQADVVDIVSTQGGFGHKMSNKFIIGVADLLLKPYGCNAAVIEVKRDVRPSRGQGLWVLDVTVAQRNYLRRAARGGMKAGVLSFIIVDQEERYRLFPMSELEALASHRLDKDGAERIEYRVSSSWYTPFTGLEPVYQSIVEFCEPCTLTLMKCLNSGEKPTGTTARNVA